LERRKIHLGINGKSIRKETTKTEVDNIKMDVRGIKWDGMDQWRGFCEHGNEHPSSIKCW
jgi:hypothetical protein